MAAVIREAIETDAIIETAKQADVVLKPDIRPPASATAKTTAAAATTTTKALATATSAAHARPASVALETGRSSGADVAKRVAAPPAAPAWIRPIAGAKILAIASTTQVLAVTAAAQILAATSAAQILTIAAAWSVAGIPVACIQAPTRLAASEVSPVTDSGLQDLLAVAATKVHAVLRAVADVAIATKFLRDVGVGITHALAMR